MVHVTLYKSAHFVGVRIIYGSLTKWRFAFTHQDTIIDYMSTSKFVYNYNFL